MRRLLLVSTGSTGSETSVVFILIFPKGDSLLVSEEFDDGWMRGLRLSDLEVGSREGRDRGREGGGRGEGGRGGEN